MKISFECDCILLQNSLLSFCKDFIAHRKDCDFIVSDKKTQTPKPLFLIAPGGHINVPFNKRELINVLEEFYSAIQIKPIPVKNSQIARNGGELEAQILALFENFKKDLIALIRANRE